MEVVGPTAGGAKVAVSFLIALPLVLLLLALLIAGLVVVFRKLGGVALALALMVVLGLPIMFALLVPVVSHVERSSTIERIHQDLPGSPPQVEAVSVASLSEEWDRFTQPRIDLSGDETHEADSHAEEPAEEAASEDATPEEAKSDDAEVEAEEPEADEEPKRPDWVDVDYHMVGNTVRCSVKSDPYHTVDECHAALEIEIQDVVRDRLARLAGVPEIKIPSPRVLGISNDYILREICREEYAETVDHSFGQMKQVYVLMEFSEPQDRRLVEAWRQYQRSGRLTVVGVISALVVGAVGLVFGLLKADTATKGYYTKRLFLGVPAAIIAALALLVVIMEIADG